MATIGALLIVKNEERHIRSCLELLTWCDEIVVVDSFSTDRTVETAREFTPKVFQHPFYSLPNQRQIALGYITTDWVWVMDADERMTPELKAEILETINSDAPFVAYWAPRRNIILGKWIRHAGWYPDYQLRLWRVGRAHYNEAYQGHERMILDGEVGYLKNTYLHYNYERIGQLFAKQDFYANLEARTLHSFGQRARPQNFVLQPLREFARRYIEWQGYKDGLHGFFLSLIMGWFNVLTYWKLLRLGGMEWSVGRRQTPTRGQP